MPTTTKRQRIPKSSVGQITSGIPETQAEASAKERAVSRNHGVIEFDEWFDLLVEYNDLYRDVPRSVARGWYDAGFSVPEAKHELREYFAKESIHGEMDLRDDPDEESSLSDSHSLTHSIQEIPLEEIHPSPKNPRKIFNDGTIKRIAESIKSVGLMQAIGVYRSDATGNKWEIVFGETRYRAAKVAQVTTIPCRVLDIDDATATELRTLENLERNDLNAIEKATAYQNLLSDCQYTQRSLAKRLKISQGAIGNQLALLKLPDNWQRLLITGVITANHARDLNKWKDRPQVLEAAYQLLCDHPDYDGEQTMTPQTFASIVHQALVKVSKPVGGQFAVVKLTPKTTPLLDVVDIPRSWGGSEKRAFNLEEHQRLEKDAKKRQRERAKKEHEASARKVPKGTTTERTWSDHGRVREQLGKWLSHSIAQRCVAQPKKEKLLATRVLLLLISTSQDCLLPCNGAAYVPFLSVLDPALGQMMEREFHDYTKSKARQRQVWLALRNLDPKNLDDVIRQLVLQTTNWEYGWELQAEVLLEIARELGVEFDLYRATKEHLEPYDEQTLRGLIAEHIVAEGTGFDRKEDLIAVLVNHWPAGVFPPGWAVE